MLREKIESFGVSVKVLDVKGDADEVLRRAGKLYGAERQAERVIRDRKERMERLLELRIPKGRRVVVLLGIRNPIRHESYVFRVAAHSDLSQLLRGQFEVMNLFESTPEKDLIAGIQDLGSVEELFDLDPDLICLTGDALAGTTALQKTLKAGAKPCRAITEGRIAALPYYCDALSWRAPFILEEWSEALMW